MPNWCENTLKVSGKETELKLFMDAVKTDTEPLSLDKLVPMPKELNGTESPGDEPNWYNWRISNWGVKWDVANTTLTSRRRVAWYSFDTAWSPPITWLEKASAMFPKITFTLKYDEPGMCFRGKAVAENGVVNDECKNY